MNKLGMALAGIATAIGFGGAPLTWYHGNFNYRHSRWDMSKDPAEGAKRLVLALEKDKRKRLKRIDDDRSCRNYDYKKDRRLTLEQSYGRM